MKKLLLDAGVTVAVVLGLLFFTIRVGLTGTVTTIILGVVNHVTAFPGIVIPLTWLYIFFVVGRTIFFIFRKRSIDAFVLHSQGTSRLLWIGLGCTVLIMATASFANVSPYISLAWSVFFVFSMSYMVLLDLFHDAVPDIKVLRRILGIETH